MSIALVSNHLAPDLFYKAKVIPHFCEMNRKDRFCNVV